MCIAWEADGDKKFNLRKMFSTNIGSEQFWNNVRNTWKHFLGRIFHGKFWPISNWFKIFRLLSNFFFDAMIWSAIHQDSILHIMQNFPNTLTNYKGKSWIFFCKRVEMGLQQGACKTRWICVVSSMNLLWILELCQCIDGHQCKCARVCLYLIRW